MMRARPMLPLALVPVMAMLLFAFGCDEDPTLPCTHLPGGRLQGEVRTGGLPSEAVIMATWIIDGVSSEYTFETDIDEAGNYALDLPEGNYIVQLRPGNSSRFIYDYSAAGLGYGQIPPDTLLINDSVSPVVANFSLGSLTLHIELSDYLEGEIGRFELFLRDAVEPGGWRTYLDEGGTTIENGQADIQAVGLLPGEYRIEIVLGNRDFLCNCSYEGEHLWMPGIRDEAESPWYGVVADSVTALSISIPQNPARIEGLINGAWLSMGLGSYPKVSIVNPDSVTIIGSRQVHHDGSFDFTVHLPEPVKILVEQNGIQQWIGGPGFAEATVYDLRLGETITDVELNQCGLRLNIVGEGFDSINSSSIRIHDPFDMELVATAPMWQGHGGVVPVTNLYPGEYILSISPSVYDLGKVAWRPQWFDRMADSADAQVVSIGSFGEVVRVDLTLEHGGTISGQLEFSSPPDGGYRVLATPADQYLTWGSSYSSEDPHFVLQGLPDGSYKVGVFPTTVGWFYGGPPPAETLWYPGTGNWDDAEIVEIIDASDHEGLNILVN